jgi:L-threonylcarbamoyladenylate synthase
MPKIFKLVKLDKEKIEFLKKEILNGRIFIYPTDTIYGLGCNALDKKAVNKILEIKSRDKDKPLSIIAPSIKWIKENCVIDLDLEKYLPGAYTIVLKKKNKDFLFSVSKGDTLGVRIPKCDFTKIIQETGLPFITTSVNLSGEKPITKINEIKETILNNVDYIIDTGVLNNPSSTLIIKGKEAKR